MTTRKLVKSKKGAESLQRGERWEERSMRGPVGAGATSVDEGSISPERIEAGGVSIRRRPPGGNAVREWSYGLGCVTWNSFPPSRVHQLI